MAGVYGGSVWRECMAGVYGGSVWRECMAGVYGGSVWRECMTRGCMAGGPTRLGAEKPCFRSCECHDFWCAVF